MRTLYFLYLALVVVACGEAEKPGKVVAGFTFEITVDPATFAPTVAKAVRVASDGDPATNPPDTVQLYTPNDTLGWTDRTDADVFSFDVVLTSFYAKKLCNVIVVVDTIDSSSGRFFVEDDRGRPYAAGVTGAGVWVYGDAMPRQGIPRRWQLALSNHEHFTLHGRVLADPKACAR